MTVNLTDKEVVEQRVQQLADAIEGSMNAVADYGGNALGCFDNLRRLHADLKMCTDALLESNKNLRVSLARYRKQEEARSRQASRQARWDADYVPYQDDYDRD